MYNEVQDELGLDTSETETLVNNIDLSTCPECGEELYHETGCISCKFCGFSKCN